MGVSFVELGEGEHFDRRRELSAVLMEMFLRTSLVQSRQLRKASGTCHRAKVSFSGASGLKSGVRIAAAVISGQGVEGIAREVVWRIRICGSL